MGKKGYMTNSMRRWFKSVKIWLFLSLYLPSYKKGVEEKEIKVAKPVLNKIFFSLSNLVLSPKRGKKKRRLK